MGAKSRNVGILFEEIFFKLCRLKGCGVTRIPDGCRQLKWNRLIRVQSPFDWIVTYQGKTALIDTKTVQTDTFPYSLVKPHQLDELLIHERSGGYAGYVIWLRGLNKIFYLPASALEVSKKASGSFSHIHPQAILLGDQNFDLTLIFQERKPREDLCERRMLTPSSDESKIL